PTLPQRRHSTLLPYTTLFRSALNYAAAISKLSPLPFFLGTAVGIIPGTLLAAFIGDRLAAGIHGKSKRPYLFAGAGVLIMLGLSDRKSTRLNSSHDQISYVVF